MAKKRGTKPLESDKRERIEAALRQKDFSGALALLKISGLLDPTVEQTQFYAASMMRLATDAIYDAPRAVLNAILKELDEIPSADPEWQRKRAMLHARCGNLKIAQELATTPEWQAELLGHLVDRAVRLQIPALVPENLKPHYESYLRAYQLYMEGKDEESQQAMQVIGLTSPFLEWKVLLRGLIAFAKNDSPRAMENWKRLNPARLPHRLSRPLQLQIDPASLPNASVEEKTHFQKSMQALTDTELVRGIRQILTGMAKDRNLQPVWREVERVAPMLKKEHPDLLPRLGRSMYWSIIKQGEHRDMAHYKKQFGEPHDDPRFFRLEGIILEELQELEPAIESWQKYEKWLASRPIGWSPAMLNHARAKIFYRIAGLVDRHSQQDEEDLFFDEMLPFGPKKKRSKSKPKYGTIEQYYIQCMTLAPNWLAPALDLICWYMDVGRLKEAKALGERYLERFPRDIDLLELMVSVEAKIGDVTRVRHYNERLMQADPLDRSIRKRVAMHLIHDAHALLMDRPEAMDPYLVTNQQLCIEAAPAYYYAMRWVWAKKQKNEDLQNELHEAVSRIPGARLAYSLARAVYAGYLLKPAEKTLLRKELKEVKAKSPQPLEVANLCETWVAFKVADFTYVGQKTIAKEILTLARKSVDSQFPVADGETLIDVLRGNFTGKQLKTLTEILVYCHRESAVLLIHWLEVHLELGQQHNMMHECRKHYEKARQLIEQLPQSEQKPLKSRLEAIKPFLRSDASIFDALFEQFRKRL